MPFAPRTLTFLLAAFALASAGCGSNNKGKIEGKWKVVSLPDKAKGQDDLAQMAKFGVYICLDFRPDGGATFGVSADNPEFLELMKKAGPDQKTSWDLKYKLLAGDGVELYDVPKDLQTKGGGLFGSKERARVNVKINGNEMQMTDNDGTATLTKLAQ